GRRAVRSRRRPWPGQPPRQPPRALERAGRGEAPGRRRDPLARHRIRRTTVGRRARRRDREPRVAGWRRHRHPARDAVGPRRDPARGVAGLPDPECARVDHRGASLAGSPAARRGTGVGRAQARLTPVPGNADPRRYSDPVISYFQAIVIGLLQGVTELFPISSLGHSVLIPALFGWDEIAKSQSKGESFYLAFLVALHVATAIALLIYFRADWARIIGGFFRTLRTRKIESPDERMAWLLVPATTPAGIPGLVLEHTLRTQFAKPLAAAIFLFVNGCILLVGERYRRRASVRELVAAHDQARSETETGRRLDT